MAVSKANRSDINQIKRGKQPRGQTLAKRPCTKLKPNTGAHCVSGGMQPIGVGRADK